VIALALIWLAEIVFGMRSSTESLRLNFFSWEDYLYCTYMRYIHMYVHSGPRYMTWQVLEVVVRGLEDFYYVHMYICMYV